MKAEAWEKFRKQKRRERVLSDKDSWQAGWNAALDAAAEIAVKCECGACECSSRNRDAILALKGEQSGDSNG